MKDFLKNIFTPNKTGSKPLALNSGDVIKFLRDGAIVGAISALGWYGAHLDQVLTMLGDLAVPVASLAGMGISALVRWLTNNGPKA